MLSHRHFKTSFWVVRISDEGLRRQTTLYNLIPTPYFFYQSGHYDQQGFPLSLLLRFQEPSLMRNSCDHWLGRRRDGKRLIPKPRSPWHQPWGTTHTQATVGFETHLPVLFSILYLLHSFNYPLYRPLKNNPQIVHSKIGDGDLISLLQQLFNLHFRNLGIKTCSRKDLV